MSNFKYILQAIIKINELDAGRGKIKCPKCAGELSYSKAKSNGHIWGKCESNNCLTWMQ